MKVLVSDTSVLIDLERGSLLETSFRLSFEFAVPDLLFKQELEDYGGQRLIELGLRIEELDEEGTKQAINFKREIPSLSTPDSFAFALASKNSWTLLAGDGALRKLANTQKVNCHGVLWLMDQMQNESVATIKELHTGLQAISSHPNCRLPRVEINKRLKIYSAS